MASQTSLKKTVYVPLWHYRYGIKQKNLIEQYRSLGKLGLQEMLKKDDIAHHQPIYWIIGLGDRSLGKAVIGRLAYLFCFPFWVQGKILMKLFYKVENR